MQDTTGQPQVPTDEFGETKTLSAQFEHPASEPGPGVPKIFNNLLDLNDECRTHPDLPN